MIDYKIDGRDLVKRGLDIEVIEKIEAKKQCLMIRLGVERGSFIYDETLGSRLKLLLNEKPSKVKQMADLYVREALEPEEDIEIIKVDVKWLDKRKILILVYFIWNDNQDSLEVII